MQRSQLYMIIGALVVVVAGLGIYLLREEQKPEGVEIKVDQNGISVQQN